MTTENKDTLEAHVEWVNEQISAMQHQLAGLENALKEIHKLNLELLD